MISADSFAEGIAAFRSGRYNEANKLLQAFLGKNPSDPRTEDAAFLLAVSRARLGDAHGAAVLAREYLRRFPNGLRRPEAESLSREAP
jgi:TolA-binding protein